MRRFLTIAAMLPLVGLAPLARGEEFALRGGGQITGEWLNPDQVPRTDYAIGVGNGRIVLPAAAVEEVRTVDPAEVEYRRIRPGFADTASDQWALAEWCLEHGLDRQRRTHLKRTIELDPDHAEARRILGYAKHNGEWKTPEQVMTEQGYVRYKGRWRTPQEVQLMERDERTERAEKEWYVRIRRWRDWLGGNRAAEGRRQLLGITDPLAVPGLADHLADEENPQARILLIEALANVGTPDALKVLAKQAMDDPIEEVRLTCLDYLKKTKSPSVVEYFAGKLKSKDNKVINRAGVALGAMGSPAAVSPLIDALVTEHKFKITPGGGSGSMSVGFPTGGSGGGGGLSMNQKPKIVKQMFRNQAVLDALVAITDQSYGYNQQAWRHWLASQRRRIQFDPRRD